MTTFKLSDVIKEIRLTRKNVPTNRTIFSWLKGTEFDGNPNEITFDLKKAKACKKFIEDAIKNLSNEKKRKNKFDRLYLYVYLGGTKELNNLIRIDAKDHFTNKQISPKGCEKYCTENQTGKPQNWVKLPVITMPNGEYIDTVYETLTKLDEIESRVSTDTFKIKPDIDLVDFSKNTLLPNIYNAILNKWYGFNYNY